MDESAWASELERAREQQLRRIRDPQQSPYAAVERRDFEGERELRFGSAPDCDVRLEGLRSHHLGIRALADAFEVRAAEEGAAFRVLDGEGAEVRSARVGPGARVAVGRYTLRLSHQNFPGVLVLDPESPLLSSGPPPRWFPPDPAFRAVARLAREAAPREEVVLSTRGNRRRGLRLGAFELQIKGRAVRLAALRLLEPGVGEAELSIFFRDETSGTETYPVGRYLEPAPAAGQPDTYVLDFNRAYNPTCAFSPLYNCPVPPRENRLPLAVRAGELHPHAHDD